MRLAILFFLTTVLWVPGSALAVTEGTGNSNSGQLSIATNEYQHGFPCCRTLDSVYTNELSGTINMNSGRALQMNGTMINMGTINNNGGNMYILHTMENEGPLNNSGLLYYAAGNSGGYFVNYGTLTNSGTFQNTGNGPFANNGTLINSGTLNHTSIKEFTTIGTLTNQGDLNNSETLVNCQSGGLCTLTNESGGTLTNKSGATLINNGSLVNHGTLNNESGATIANNGTIDTTNGSFNNAGVIGGTGHITGNVSGSGYIAPGQSAGVLTIDGHLAHDGGGHRIEIGGHFHGGDDKSRSEFDWLHVTGNVELAGTLEVSLIDDFELLPEMSFHILKVDGTLTGQYDGLGEGERVGRFAGTDLYISYRSGDANGVTLYSRAEDVSPRCEAAMDRAAGHYSKCLLSADASHARHKNATKLANHQARCETRFDRRTSRAITRHGADECPSSDLVAAMADRTVTYAEGVAIEASGRLAPSLLFVQDGTGGTLSRTTLTLTGVSSQTGYFSDRPYRFAGQEPTEEFIALWDEGGPFADDLPNADFTCTVDSEVVNYVVELTSPSMTGEDLSYSVNAVGDTVLPETQITCEADSHLFVDTAVNQRTVEAEFGRYDTFTWFFNQPIFYILRSMARIGM